MVKRKCNHNPNDRKNTFRQLGLLTMVCPRVYHAQCSVCGELFEYTKTANGYYKLVPSPSNPTKEEGNNVPSFEKIKEGGESDADISRDL